MNGLPAIAWSICLSPCVIPSGSRQASSTLHSKSVVRCAFFFQAEDGIRDLTVTGVQTCALPISGNIGDARQTLGTKKREPANGVHCLCAVEQRQPLFCLQLHRLQSSATERFTAFQDRKSVV